MTTVLSAGPYRMLTTVEGDQFPYYIIPFDRDGRCEGPQTRDNLLGTASSYSDIFLFSHGWNNDWTAALRRYESFIHRFQTLRRQQRLAMPPGYKPLLVGIFWPSQAMEWFESETGPDIAAADPAAQDAAVRASTETLRDIAADLAPEKRSRFYKLAQAQTLGQAEASELAQMLASLAAADDEGVRADAPSAQDLLAAAAALATPEPDYDAIGTAAGTAAAPQAAFGIGDILSALDPRDIVKPFTVWQLKDRAGTVGANGVVPLLEGLLTRSSARVHLLGHSFGCKVVMTATCVPASLPRQVESALLLQPAVSQYAFAPSVPERHVPGGFVKALARVRRPIVATFSAHDAALTKMFHLAVRRHDDLGELQYAAGGSPSLYGALGGFGPQDSGVAFDDVRDPGSNYDLSGHGRIIGVNSTRTISGHGDITNPSTWWLAYALATAHHRYS